jgi:putative OmpL-like beta-barrel porin-2
MSKFLFHCKGAFAASVLMVTLLKNPCAAQTGTESSGQQASAANQPAAPDVMQELEAMKKRIEQLEGELKKRTEQEHPAAGLPREAKTPVSLPTEPQQRPAPFAFADFTWLNGNPRNKDSVLDSKYFTGEFRVDSSYIQDFNHPIDHSLGGTTEGTRTGEFQVQHLGVGGDFHAGNMQGRILTQFGMYSTATPRNDASTSIGQWNLADAYRYVTEAYGGYHLNVQNGINIQAGIFMSYIGLFSYYNFDNWTYQPSYVSSNTPWFFNGMRVQWFPTAKLKIEPWLINGWQSYGKFNGRPGVGAQILWRPTSWFSFVGNQYGVGQDTVGLHRTRWHTDDSIEVKYYDHPAKALDKMAFSLTLDAGCENGGGVTCTGGAKGPAQNFLGFMFYNRWWFHRDLFAVTMGGGGMSNPGRYLVLMPPINGATAASGTPYFSANPGNQFRAWDAQATFDYMPSQFLTWRFEYTHRAANVPYFSGPGGVTPPGGNTFGAPGSFVPGWFPDLRKRENRIIIALLVKL